MPYKEQIELRLKIIDSVISEYSTMQHNPFMSKKDIENTLYALILWRNETELLLHLDE